MNKKIIFQKCNFNSFYFLFYIIGYALSQTMSFFLDAEDDDKEVIKYSEFSRQFVMIVSSNISNFLGIIPYFIRKQLLKKSNISSNKIETIETNDTDNESKDKTELIYNDIKISETQKRKKLVLIFCVLVGFSIF